MRPFYNWSKRCTYGAAYGQRQTLLRRVGCALFKLYRRKQS